MKYPLSSILYPPIDLQWFAAEDEGRTEEATERKIRRAREEEGRVAKSQELVGALGLLVPFLVIVFTAPSMLRTCVEMLRFFLERSVEIDLDPTRSTLVWREALRFFARLAAPVAAIAFVTAIFSNLVQVGFVWTMKPLSPHFARLFENIPAYFTRVFSAEGAFKFVMSLVKIVIVGVVAYTIIHGNINRLANMQKMSLWTGVTTISGLALQLLIVTALLMLALALPDYFFQRRQFRQSLMMTKQEVKEEFKETEGDPQMKARLQQRMRELLSTDLREAVARSKVVITNPTHLAIALEYSEELREPRVTAKGEDEVAQRIKTLAREYEVPTVENKPLARAMYPEVEVGDTVPEKYWAVIATILARVMKITR